MKVNTSLPLQRVMDTAEKIGSFLIVEDLDSSDGEESDDENIESMLCYFGKYCMRSVVIM